jgi:hypothetical protein
VLLSAIKWLAFLWGTLALGVMGYYAVRWFPHAADVRYNEMAMGFAIGAFYGWPSWLVLPAFAVAQRRELPRWQLFLLVAPVFLAFALYVVGQSLARGGI